MKADSLFVTLVAHLMSLLRDVRDNEGQENFESEAKVAYENLVDFLNALHDEYE